MSTSASDVVESLTIQLGVAGYEIEHQVDAKTGKDWWCYSRVDGTRCRFHADELDAAIGALEVIVADANSFRGYTLAADDDPFIDAARTIYSADSNNNIEVDANPALSHADGGTWVAAWLWVPTEDPDA